MRVFSIFATAAALVLGLSVSAHADDTNTCDGVDSPASVGLVLTIEGGASQDVGTVEFECSDEFPTVIVTTIPAPEPGFDYVILLSRVDLWLSGGGAPADCLNETLDIFNKKGKFRSSRGDLFSQFSYKKNEDKRFIDDNILDMNMLDEGHFCVAVAVGLFNKGGTSDGLGSHMPRQDTAYSGVDDEDFNSGYLDQNYSAQGFVTGVNFAVDH